MYRQLYMIAYQDSMVSSRHHLLHLELKVPISFGDSCLALQKRKGFCDILAYDRLYLVYARLLLAEKMKPS